MCHTAATPKSRPEDHGKRQEKFWSVVDKNVLKATLSYSHHFKAGDVENTAPILATHSQRLLIETII